MSLLDQLKKNKAAAPNAHAAIPAQQPAQTAAAAAPAASGGMSALDKLRAKASAQTAPAQAPAQAAATPAASGGMSALDKLKAKAAAAPATPAVQPTVAAEAPPAELESVESVIRVLLIDCLPMPTEAVDTSKIVDASAIIQAANAEVCEALEIAHWSYIEYGKGIGALAETVGGILDTAGPGGVDTVTVDSRACPGEVLSLLIANSRFIVRGVR